MKQHLITAVVNFAEGGTMKRLFAILAVAAAAAFAVPGTAQAGIEVTSRCGTGIDLDAPLGWSAIEFTVSGLESGTYYYVGVTVPSDPYSASMLFSGQVAGGNRQYTDYYGSLTLLVMPASAVTVDPSTGAVITYDVRDVVFLTTIIVPSCTAGKIAALEDAVAALDVNAGIATSLDAKISHVHDALDAARANSTTVACNSLDAFINQVGAEESGGQIAAADAANLVGLANDIKARLGCP